VTKETRGEVPRYLYIPDFSPDPLNDYRIGGGEGGSWSCALPNSHLDVSTLTIAKARNRPLSGDYRNVEVGGSGGYGWMGLRSPDRGPENLLRWRLRPSLVLGRNNCNRRVSVCKGVTCGAGWSR